jgi:hypothetical protein
VETTYKDTATGAQRSSKLVDTTFEGANKVVTTTFNTTEPDGRTIKSVDTEVSDAKTGANISYNGEYTYMKGNTKLKHSTSKKVYDKLGGYTYSYSEDIYSDSGQLTESNQDNETFDADNKVQSGDRTFTKIDKNAAKTVTKYKWDSRWEKWMKESP